ncbi:EAL domain-containing protein [Sphingomonas sp. BK235]|uniref:putative bifunctional diguanylate cyclase/phosphodiesterase n=1 Tax=Sphingomonas sp. BK235 TaxID=2512131 RepID=UPI00104F7B5B|nr:EAL domain-containing protein [Sphingomonas sp. BK235]TCP34656.1 diguanylate cyclase/phosphodiesterase with PAS/PAC sensor(s) [Sphingomonas sp. BK235]
MTAASPPPPLSPVAVRALLGWRRAAGDSTAARLAAAQRVVARRLAPALLAILLVASGVTVALLADALPATWLGAWLAAATLAAAALVHRLRQRDADEPALSGGAVRAAAALGLVWAIVPLLFAPRADAGTAHALHLLIGTVSTAIALAAATLAPAALAFLLVGGAAAALGLMLGGDRLGAVGAMVFTLLLALIVLARARAVARFSAAVLALEEREATVRLLLREVGDGGGDWLWETDAARRIIGASERLAHACACARDDLEGMPFLQLLAGPDWERGTCAEELRLIADRMTRREPFNAVALRVTVAGEARWWELTATPRLDPAGRFAGYRGVASDITEQRASAEKISRMARFDALTGLPNRLFVNEELARALTDAERWRARCAFMMIDLDRFKAVNDTLGHPVGDRLLRRVSERLAQLVTDNELIGRLGGDEFAVVVRDASDAARLERLARTIIETLSQPYEVDQHTLYIGASVGVATGPRDGRTAETLIRSADLALYRSKDQGGGVYHAYVPQLHVEAEERRVIELALRRALDNEELHLAYQPVVDARTGAVRGFEALLRWHHPELGNIPPAKFVPIAEDARLIAPIGAWVLRTACAEAAGWPDDVRIAVNVSPDQLHNPQFVGVITAALAETGLPARRLELEVTESVFLREGTGAVQLLKQILDLGVGLSLDDFGTGYSSLGYLSATRFSSIKIDRSFVQAASRGTAEAIAIIRAVVAMAQSMGMATTAEGVESEAELRLAQELGCGSIQGFYFGRPLPVAEARALALSVRRPDAPPAPRVAAPADRAA